MRATTLAFLVVSCVALTGRIANAVGDADAAISVFVEKCTTCHEVPGYGSRRERAAVNAPSFEEIAKKPEVYTTARLRVFLRKPHWPMSQFILSPGDIDNLIAFIERLRRSRP